MKAKIKNWTPETLDDEWFTKNSQDDDRDMDFLNGRASFPLKKIPFFFSVECTPSAFVLFMGQLLGAAVSGEIEIREPETHLPLGSILASPLDDEIEVTPYWNIDADEVAKFASRRRLAWAGDWAGERSRQLVEKDASPPEATRPSAAKRTQNTLLCIIAALAHRARIDLNERGAAKRIEEWTESAGAAVGAETIKGYLDMIPDAIDRRSK